MYSMLFTTLLVAAVSAKPLENAYPTPSNAAGDLTTSKSSGKLLDNFSQSDLDFEQWIDRMVEEGQVFRPNNTESGLMVFTNDDGDSWTVTVKNVACSTVTGNKELLDDAEAHFCDDFIKRAGALYARELELDVMRLLCDGGTFCKLGVKSVFDWFGLLPTADDIAGVCHDMFNAVQNACPDGGGVADTEVMLGNGETGNGQLEFSYSLGNEACQADATHECFDREL